MGIAEIFTRGFRAGRAGSEGAGEGTGTAEPRGHAAPARLEHLPERPRGLCSAEMPLNTPKLGLGCLLSTCLGGLSPFTPLFYYLFPAKSAQDSYPSLFPLGVRR